MESVNSQNDYIPLGLVERGIDSKEGEMGAGAGIGDGLRSGIDAFGRIGIEADEAGCGACRGVG